MNWPDDKLSRFEIARLIGARSLQVALGAPVLLKSIVGMSSLDIAKEEFRQSLIPMTVKRKMPNGSHSIVNIKKAISNWLAEKNGEI